MVNQQNADDIVEEIQIVEDDKPNATIKVIEKRATKKLDSTAYIFDGSKKIWKYTNDDGKTKIDEIINIITQMVDFMKDKNIKLVIDVNYTLFKKEYLESLREYKDLEKNVEQNLVQKSIDDVDVGKYKNIHKVFKYESLIKLKDHFKLKG